MTEPKRKTFGYVRAAKHEQAIRGLSLEARKRKVIICPPATEPPLASKAFTRSLARPACADSETRKTEHEEEDRTN